MRSCGGALTLPRAVLLQLGLGLLVVVVVGGGQLLLAGLPRLLLLRLRLLRLLLLLLLQPLHLTELGAAVLEPNL